MTILRAFAATMTAGALALGTASAASVSLSADAEQVDIGDTVEIALTFTADEAAEFLVDNLFELSFDSDLFAFVGADFTDPATDQNQLDFELGGLFEAEVTDTGLVEVSAASDDFFDVLAEQQADAFTVVTLSFEALANGTGEFALTDFSTFLFAIGLDGELFEADIAGGALTVDAVPLPGAAIFLLTGAAGLVARRRLAA